MTSDQRERLAAFAGCRVLVVGEAMLDSYIEGSASRLCREAPVPIVAAEGCSHAPGAAANTAMNVHALGGEVTFLSVAGADADGACLRALLQAGGIATEHLLAATTRRTLAKRRISAGGHMLLRIDQGSTQPLEPGLERELRDRLLAQMPRHDAVIISDYGYGVVTRRLIRTLAGLQARSPRTLVLDGKNLTAYRAVGATAAKPNYDEVLALLGKQLLPGQDRAAWLLEQGDRLLRLTGTQLVAATLDVQGAIIFQRGCVPYRTYATPASNSRSTGAGDTYTSALALALAAGLPAPPAADLASLAASVVMEKDGTATCSLQELGARLNIGGTPIESDAQLRCVGNAETSDHQAAEVTREGETVHDTSGSGRARSVQRRTAGVA
ncbi:MAG: bifunctional heptose 7-phosphate kinase/heptose 1-phosphate adenyltransferase [Chloroflexi bacterium]|nr:bifunctional heptose 7-phosphate kinase/heptose 1-phosphate adenyltransferase [Chloroflexota bacterium]